MGIFNRKRIQKKRSKKNIYKENILTLGEAAPNKPETYILNKTEYKNVNSPNLFVLTKTGAGKSFHLILGKAGSGKAYHKDSTN